MTKAASGTANEALVEQLKELGVRGVLMDMANAGQLLELKCEMPKCYYHKGRGSFDPKTHPPTNWAPSADHYPVPKAAGGELKPWNVRLAHVMCNREDHGWRSRINTLLRKGESLDGIAEDLNKKHVRAPHGRNTWTAATVRKAFVS
jgi:hypothetical protein